MMRHRLHKIQYMCKDHLGHGTRSIDGNVGHGDSAFPSRIDIHDVVPGRQHADIAQQGKLHEDVRVQHGLIS